MLFVQLHVAGSARAAHFVLATNGEMLTNLALGLEDGQDNVSDQHQTVPDADEDVSVSRSTKGIETQVDGGERQDGGDVAESPEGEGQFRMRIRSKTCRRNLPVNLVGEDRSSLAARNEHHVGQVAQVGSADHNQQGRQTKSLVNTVEVRSVQF